MKRIAIFASGSGSNAENIFEYFKNSENVEIVSFITNNPNAKVLDRAKRLGVDSLVFNRTEFNNEEQLGAYLKENADFIVLAGFLWRIPEYMVKQFEGKMVNIHPALLPNYGGKGMYGMNVHKAVVKNKETETGITIHYVNENYDEGAIIYQAKTQVSPSDTAEDVAAKIHALEYEHFPKIIEQVLLKNG